MQEPDEALLMRIKLLMTLELIKEDLRLPPGYEMHHYPYSDRITAYDPVWPNPVSTNKIGRDVQKVSEKTPEAIASELTPHARGCIRRLVCRDGRRKSEKTKSYAPGWTAFAHPLGIAIARHIGLVADVLPPAKTSDVPKGWIKEGITLETQLTNDLLSISIDNRKAGGQMQYRSLFGGTTLSIVGKTPETLMMAAPGRRLTAIADIPKTGDPRVDDAVAAIVVRRMLTVSGNVIGNGIVSQDTYIELEPARWIPYGTPPDAETARLLALEPEIH